MFIDADLEFSTEQAITASAVSENIVNAGAANRLGGSKIHAFVDGEDFTLLTSLSVSLKSASTAAGVAAGTTHWTSGAVAAATLVDGYVFDLPDIPREHGQYLGLYYTVTGTNPDAGKISGGIILDRQTAGGE
jgi:hypothetical protein